MDGEEGAETPGGGKGGRKGAPKSSAIVIDDGENQAHFGHFTTLRSLTACPDDDDDDDMELVA
jgi:hypothetical protein